MTSKRILYIASDYALNKLLALKLRKRITGRRETSIDRGKQRQAVFLELTSRKYYSRTNWAICIIIDKTTSKRKNES
jgi:hypothetical protein